MFILMLVAVLAALVIIGVLVLVLIFMLANRQWQFTRIAKGTIALIVKSGDLKVILPNVDGVRVSYDKDSDGRWWLVRVNTKNSPKKQKREMREAFEKSLMPGTKLLQWILWDKFGIRFVSWFWPQIRVKETEIDVSRFGSDISQTTPLDQMIEEASKNITGIRFKFPRPILIKGVELSDGSRIDILLLPIYQLVIPTIPIFTLDGDFMKILDSILSTLVMNFFASFKVPVDKDGHYDSASSTKTSLTYALWLELPKNILMDYLKKKINVSKAYLDSLPKELGEYLKSMLGDDFQPESPNLLQHTGFIATGISIVRWTADARTQELAQAMQALATKKAEAEGVKAEAEGKAEATKTMGDAEGERLTNLVKALTGLGVTKDTAATVVGMIEQAEAIGASQLTTWVQGGGSPPSILLPPAH